jgi:arsenate reductase
MNRKDLGRRLLAEWLGSALLAAVVIGSGIAAQRLSPGQTGLELFRTRRPPPPGLGPTPSRGRAAMAVVLNPPVRLAMAAVNWLAWSESQALAVLLPPSLPVPAGYI